MIDKENRNIILALLSLCIVLSATVVINKFSIDDIEKALITQNKINSELRAEINQIKKKRISTVTVTAYSPRERETDSTPYTTAFMQPVSNRTIALPWHLIQKGWLPNRCVYLKIDSALYGGLYKINDKMADRHMLNADIFFWSTEHAVEFGRIENVDMIYLGECP
ncbi:MAG: hypothetical protein P8X74_03800 [Reinekea sp.]